MPESWKLEQLAAATPKDFRFFVRAHKSLLNDARSGWLSVAEDFRKALSARPFRERLAGIIFEFSSRFRYEDANRLYLGELTKEFSNYPVFVEFRNDGWRNASVENEAARRGIVIVSSASPDRMGAARDAIKTSSGTACLRLHGRNAAAWWSEEPSARYDYSYSTAELSEWADKLIAAESRATAVFALFGNYPRGNAILDAKRLRSLIDASRPRLAPLSEAP